MEWFVFWLILNVIVGYAIGRAKDNVAGGIIWSVLLGPIGWIIAAILPGGTRKCPFCAELIKPDAVVCRHCGRDLPPAPSAKVKGGGPQPLSQKYDLSKRGG